MADGNEPESELSAEQLQDLVVAAVPTTEGEVIFLCNLLDDAGIPNSTQGDRTGYGALLAGGFNGTRLFVPRVLCDKAKILIDDALAQVKRGRVDDAFEPGNVADALEDKKADPLMLEMAGLRDDSEENRNEILADFITQWQRENMSSVDMARYLAAAGLSREQADMLMKAVVKQRGAEIESTGSSYSMTGIVMIGGGFLWLVILFTQLSPGRSIGYGFPSFLMVAGFAFLVLGSSTKPRASLLENEEARRD